MTVMSRLLRMRWFVRSPNRLYERGLGHLFGEDMLMLRHRGRSSGEWRTAVLEVTGRLDADTFVVVAGLGPRSQWVRNVAADPQVQVSVGRRRDVAAQAVRLDPQASAAHLERYAAAQPRRWRTFEPVMTPWAEPLAAKEGEDDWRRVVPVIELRLHPAPG